jgi:hypothetical protein
MHCETSFSLLNYWDNLTQVILDQEQEIPWLCVSIATIFMITSHASGPGENIIALPVEERCSYRRKKFVIWKLH